MKVPWVVANIETGGVAIEDAASLCTLLPKGTRSSEVPERLALYEKTRDTRAHKIQEISRLVGSQISRQDRELNGELAEGS